MHFQLPSPTEWRLQQAALCVDRAQTELRRGRCLLIRTAGRADWLFVAVETLTPSSWQQWQQMSGNWRLFLSAQRVLSLQGMAASGEPASSTPLSWETPGIEQPFRLRLAPDTSLAALWGWAGLALQDSAKLPDAARLAAVSDGQDDALESMAAALALARQGRLAPAVLGLPLPADWSAGQEAAEWRQSVLAVDAGQVLEQVRSRPVRLTKVSEAPVPLAEAAQSRFVLFRELDSEFEHVAVIVGNPDLSGEAPVRVRLHSSCLTGDLFGSLRCDCGDQLRGTVARLAASGGGIVLYLSQEGRGIGLANKLRAYVKQDQGLDTLDANQALGFRMDERHFEVAGAMLQALGCWRINLLTNNPAKIAALRAAGIEVIDREAVKGGVNPHNQRYLATKLRRGGHLFEEEDLLPARHLTEN